jgi:hypothetical protein
MKKNIALCFLTYGDLSQPRIWSKFINSNYNMYIHNKSEVSGIFKKYCINDIVETKWGHISLVKATLNLFKEAYKNDANQYFVLLSDKCVPLYSADETYNIIKTIRNNIIYEEFVSPGRLRELNHRFKKMKDTQFFNTKNFSRQSQWCLLNRETVKFFIDNDYTDKFGDTFFASDEHYFISLLNKFNISYTKKQITHVNWKERSDSSKYRRSPKTYSVLTPIMIMRAKNTGCLFMRKVGCECSPEHLLSMLNYKEK